MSHLFEPFSLKSVTLRNRIVAAPMCMYSVTDGLIGEWHHAHLEQLAVGGAGLVTVEMTDVSPEGRITWGDTGLWNDEQATALKPVAAAIKAAGAVPAIQLGHAGRKASTNRPWEGDDQIADDAPHGWPVIGPSAVAFGSDKVWKVPREMTVADIERVQGDFAAAASRARETGFEWLELHFAHGFLAHSFFSPYSNRRTDRYGGSFENRARFILETFAAVRAVWPEEYPLSVRLGVVEYDGKDEETIAESIELIKRLKQAGLDFVNVSVGFSKPDAIVPWSQPAFMAPVVERVRRETGVPAGIGWGMGEPTVADQAVRNDRADLVVIGRALLANPHWPYEAQRCSAWSARPGRPCRRNTPSGSSNTSRSPRPFPIEGLGVIDRRGIASLLWWTERSLVAVRCTSGTMPLGSASPAHSRLIAIGAYNEAFSRPPHRYCYRNGSPHGNERNGTAWRRSERGTSVVS